MLGVGDEYGCNIEEKITRLPNPFLYPQPFYWGKDLELYYFKLFYLRGE